MHQSDHIDETGSHDFVLELNTGPRGGAQASGEKQCEHGKETVLTR